MSTPESFPTTTTPRLDDRLDAEVWIEEEWIVAADRRRPRPKREKNVPTDERTGSAVAGALVGLLGFRHGGVGGLLAAGAGAALLYRGITGHCPAYEAMGVDRAHADTDRGRRRIQDRLNKRGIEVEQAFLIDRSPEDLYRFWRDFENLPRVMKHLESVRVDEDGRSHWVAKAPRMAGRRVAWQAKVTDDEPNARIRWRSLPGSDIDCAGEVRFDPAPGDRGTEVHVRLQYLPTAGRLGHAIATMFGKAPGRQIRSDLRTLKRFLEVGEIPTVEGQPHGTCHVRREQRAS